MLARGNLPIAVGRNKRAEYQRREALDDRKVIWKHI